MVVPLWFRTEGSVVDGIVALMSPHLEAVLHDIGKGEVAALWNASEGRAVGDESLLDRESLGLSQVMGPYARVDARGRTWTSVSVPVAEGRGLLCLNFDRSPLEDAVRTLSQLVSPTTGQPPALFDHDWRSEIDGVVGAWCRDAGRTVTSLSATERGELLRELEHKGVFEIRHAAAHVARVLDISRATLYSQLKSVRAEAPHRSIATKRE